MSKIIVVGSSNADITGYARHLPAGGETVLGDAMNISPGGKGLNQATAAQRAGGNVVFVSRIGCDSFGDMLKKHLAAEKINTEYVSSPEDEKTSCALIEIDGETAQNRIIVIPTANLHVSSKDVDAAEREFPESGAVLCQLEIGISAVSRAMELAKKYGKPFILNPAPFAKIPEELISGSDWFTPNETEASYFSGTEVKDIESAEKAADALIGRGAKNVVITLGKNGAFFTDGKRGEHILPIDLKAVETTGAGDTFCGALAVAIAEGMDKISSLHFAVAASAISVTRKGAAASCPTRDEINALIEKTYG